MNEYEKKLDEELETLKYHAGGWKKLAKILYRLFPKISRDTVFQLIGSNEKFQVGKVEKTGIWYEAAIVLYQYLPTVGRDSILEKIENAKIFQGDKRGRPLDFTDSQVLKWHKQVEDYCNAHGANRSKACKELVISQSIKLPKKKTTKMSLEAEADRLYKTLENFRAGRRKFIPRAKEKTTSPLMEALLQDVPDYPEDDEKQ